MRAKRYTYFVSALFDGNVGNGEVWTEGGPIGNLDQIREIEASMARKTGSDQVFVTNYILMRVERLP